MEARPRLEVAAELHPAAEGEAGAAEEGRPGFPISRAVGHELVADAAAVVVLAVDVAAAVVVVLVAVNRWYLR